MDKGKSEISKNFLAVLAIAIIIGLVGHIVSVMTFNSKDHKVHGADERKSAYMSLATRKDSTSSWLKRNFELNGQTVDLIGQTFDGNLKNNSEHEISEWTMRINIKGDCFINNAWCGTVEIHQNAGKDNEKVQTLDLRKYDIEEVELDYLYDGDLLIPLSEGDYIIYHPSLADTEYPIQASSELTMGMIFYYLGDIDLSDYYLQYKSHKGYYEGSSFYAVVGLIIIWVTVFFAQIVAIITYKRAWKDMELRKTGISYMSDIYDLIYLADILSNELTPLKSNLPGSSGNDKTGVVERLKAMFIDDVTDDYKPVVEEFMDPETLEERFDRKSLACQFRSKSKGWCLIRLFSTENDESDTLRRFIFTLQNVNEEKAVMDKIEESIESAAPEQLTLSIDSTPYAIKELISESLKYTEEAAAAMGTEVSSDISPKIPDMLKGDRDKLRMVISCMLLSALKNAKGGSVKLSVFAAESKEGVERLLVSVKDSGSGTEEEDAVAGLGLNVAAEMLKLMDSELHAIRESGAGSELYFEIDQEIA